MDPIIKELNSWHLFFKKSTIHTTQIKMNNKLRDTEESVSDLKNRIEIIQSEL